jgi:tRNA-Thr(GGU) m(6)t(6)A37 methyltransferase TsaA
MIHNATIHDEAVIGMRATVSDYAVVGAGDIVGEVTEKNRDMTVWAKDLYIDLAHRYPSGLKEVTVSEASDINEAFTFRPIGVIRTDFTEPADAPRQGALAPDAKGIVELDPGLAEGLATLDEGSHVVLVFAFHRSAGYELQVTTRRSGRIRGLFATRAPNRPNPIGLTVVKLDRVEGSRLHVSGVDMLDGTPLLDIKPHAPDLIP